MNWFDDWALTLAVFVPLVGMAIVLLIPKAEEELIKVVALLTSLITLAVGIGIMLSATRYRYSAAPSTSVPGGFWSPVGKPPSGSDVCVPRCQ